MNQNDDTSARPGGASGTAGSTTEETRRSIGDTVSQASKAAGDEAKSLGNEARHLAEDKAEDVKEIAVSHLHIFADSLRAASDQLSKDQSGPASEMVAQAASGLEGLSRSLHGKSTGEMVDTIRDFGRTNPIGFLAGSVLAGVALGRFSAAGTSSEKPKSSNATSKAGTTQPHRDNFAPSAAPLATPHKDRGITS